MLENEPTGAGTAGETLTGSTTDSANSTDTAGTAGTASEPATRPRRRAARRAAGPPADPTTEQTSADATPGVAAATGATAETGGAATGGAEGAPEAEPAPRRRATRSRRRTADPEAETTPASGPAGESAPETPAPAPSAGEAAGDQGPQREDPTPPNVAVEVTAPRARRRRRSADADALAPETAAAAGPAAANSAPDRPVADGPTAEPVASATELATDSAAFAAATDAGEAPSSRRRRRSSTSRAAESSSQDTVASVPAEPAEQQSPAEDTPAEREERAASPFGVAEGTEAEEPSTHRTRVRRAPAPMITFMAPEPVTAPVRPVEPVVEASAEEDEESAEAEDLAAETDVDGEEEDENGEDARRRRRRGRRGRGRGRGENGGETGDASDADDSAEAEDDEPAASTESDDDETEDEAAASAEGEDEEGGSGSRRRRRRRRRGAGDAETSNDDPPNTVVKVRQPAPAAPPRAIEDEVQGVKGSTRLEAKRQRRREGRESNRRRPPVLTEAEFLARREAVERVMVVRQVGDRTQIAVLEDDVLVEHYVTKASSTAYAGNVYLGRVQNVLPSMEAAFVDIGKGRNAVLYAGEVNWDAAGMEGRPRKIEVALKSGDAVLVQVTKDPMGHKGARLTSQVSLPGRFLVYVPEGQMTGISRKLPDTERKRLKDILKKIVPENAGVIIRTAAEGASEAELTHDVERLEAQWQAIKEKATKGGAPTLLNAEPDLVIRVIRDVFNEDFTQLVVSGTEAWPEVEEYIRDISPDLAERLVHHTAETDVFSAYRIDDQLMKALDRKVWLPSGGSLVIDRTEAMTVVDVNTGKFTGQGGNLEETVTRNNLEAAEEIVRQLRLRDIGGIIVIDFIDMVLEANRDLVLRRLTECLGRDRTKHQVAEVTSLGLVQMTRKRVGQGLLEAFSETCEVCRGRGVIIHNEPLIGRQSGGGSGGNNGHQHSEPAVAEVKEGRRSRRKRGGGGADPAAPPAVAAAAAIHAASSRTLSLNADDDIELADDEADVTAEALIVDDVARDDAGLAYAVDDTDDIEVVDVGKPADQMVVNGVPATEPPGPVAVPAASVPAATSRPRRTRRAASRPAGPPEGGDSE
ncbi:Rne/Rng family ribonuclease [Cryptosporangium sp. NPDC051539]|uniref:Rne/Rng family ribonuclease n=1 Tax=Cryptosporangium sp. NPDC051539 TaxID=3363962 RepID=UPI0037AF0026